MKVEYKKQNIRCYACGFSMSGNGFCGMHSTSGIGYLWENNEIEIRNEFIINYNYEERAK